MHFGQKQNIFTTWGWI